VEFSLGPNAQSGHLPPGTESLLDAFDGLPPRPGLTRGLPLRRQPFRQDGLLPFLKRHLIHGRPDATPHSLHVVDLRPDGQCIEPGRRHRQGLTHGQDYSTGVPSHSVGYFFACTAVDSWWNTATQVPPWFAQIVVEYTLGGNGWPIIDPV